ncbi:apolipoprotein N-acyltransferase [Lentzea guizhouensis]|uniref:Apolipoprotein N-acyltransferase n=2 Tax=Lentzea guizhouensis TaxID=1586287 RepID=A0A1B2HUM0_9PSEU|nr:apolipoprotein N-acyltransferase [Lentzea guizhouensis]
MAPDPPDSPETPVRRRRISGPVLLRVALAVAGGVLIYLSFPPRPLWFLAPIGFALLAYVLYGRRARAGFGYGLLFGLGFMVPLLRWTGEFVGLVAWLPLAFACALMISIGTTAMAFTSRLPAWPLWAAFLWAADEALREVFPFGGFTWGKVAFGQPEGWFLPLAAVGGAPLVSFAVVLTGFGLFWLTKNWKLGLPLLVVPLVAGFGVPVGVDASAGTVTVAAIQGNVPRAGLDFNAQRRAVLDNHVKKTIELAADVAAGKAKQPDVVIWPENSSDIDPFRNADAKAAIDAAANAIKAPVAVGAVVVDRSDGLPRNQVVLWEPGKGATDTYTKRKLQPFGETMPMRSFFRLFSSDVDRAGVFQPGSDPEGFRMGPAQVALDTCYEVAFDSVVRDSVTAGATIIAIPTNNATFGRTEMTYQQLSMSRVRAVEHGRAVVVAATSGVSAIVQPDGSVTQKTGLFTPDALVATLPLRSQTTLATWLGAWPGWVLTAAGLVALALGFTRRRKDSNGAAA